MLNWFVSETKKDFLVIFLLTLLRFLNPSLDLIIIWQIPHTINIILYLILPIALPFCFYLILFFWFLIYIPDFKRHFILFFLHQILSFFRQLFTYTFSNSGFSRLFIFADNILLDIAKSLKNLHFIFGIFYSYKYLFFRFPFCIVKISAQFLANIFYLFLFLLLLFLLI